MANKGSCTRQYSTSLGNRHGNLFALLMRSLDRVVRILPVFICILDLLLLRCCCVNIFCHSLSSHHGPEALNEGHCWSSNIDEV